MARIKVDLFMTLFCLLFEMVCKASKHLFKIHKNTFMVDLVDMTYTLDKGWELSPYLSIRWLKYMKLFISLMSTMQDWWNG